MKHTFIMTIWPFAESRLQEIRKLIEEEYSIVKVERFNFNLDWSGMIRIVYVDDKIKERNYLAKVEALRKHPKFIYLVYIEVPDAKYYFKPDGRKLSESMAVLKKKIRANFGRKKDPNKNPLHIPDTHEHCANYQKEIERMC